MYYSWIDKHDSYKYIDTKLQTCTLLSSYSQTYSPLAEMTASQCFSNLSASRRMTSAESVDRDTSKKALSSTSFSKLVSWRRISSMGKIIRSHRLRSGEYGDWRSRRACLISKKEIVWRETWGLALSCIRIMFLHTTALLSLLIWWLEKKPWPLREKSNTVQNRQSRFFSTLLSMKGLGSSPRRLPYASAPSLSAWRFFLCLQIHQPVPMIARFVGIREVGRKTISHQRRWGHGGCFFERKLPWCLDNMQWDACRVQHAEWFESINWFRLFQIWISVIL